MLRRLRGDGHVCVVDDFVVTEARRNLIAKGPDALADFEALLTRIEISPARATDYALEDIVWLPEKDRPVLAAAIRLACNVLVTGDHTHFGVGYGKVFGSVMIHSPQSLARSLWPS